MLLILFSHNYTTQILRRIQILKGMESEYSSCGKELIITQYNCLCSFQYFQLFVLLKEDPTGESSAWWVGATQFHKGLQLSWEHNNGMLLYISSQFIFRDERLIKVSHADAFKTQSWQVNERRLFFQRRCFLIISKSPYWLFHFLLHKE